MDDRRRLGRNIVWFLWLTLGGCSTEGAPLGARDSGPRTSLNDAGPGGPSTSTDAAQRDARSADCTDEGCACATPDETTPCYVGDAAQAGVGACTSGTRTCVSMTEFGGVWSACTGSGAPSREVCGDRVDNDCDGTMDCSDSDCASDAACMTCPPVSEPEACVDQIDNDCDGTIDEPDCCIPEGSPPHLSGGTGVPGTEFTHCITDPVEEMGLEVGRTICTDTAGVFIGLQSNAARCCSGCMTVVSESADHCPAGVWRIVCAP